MKLTTWLLRLSILNASLLTTIAAHADTAQPCCDIYPKGRDRASAGAPSMSKVAALEVPFDKTFTLQGITFRVTSANDSSLNTLEIIPSGLETDNRSISRQIDGTVTAAEVADLNADGSPEIYG